MYSINDKPFAEKSRDKAEMVKRFGKSSLLLYTELENMKTFEYNDIAMLAQKYNLNPQDLIEFLEQRKIIITLETEQESKTVQESISETPQQISPPIPIKQPENIIQKQPENVIIQNASEKSIYDKYGEAGVKVLRVYTPKKSFLQLAEESGVSIDAVVEIVDYIRTNNLYTEEQENTRFKPKIATDIEEIENEFTNIEEFQVVKDIKDPVKKYSVKYKMPLDLSLKFGQDGKALDRYISQNQTFKIVDIAVGLKIPLSKLREMLNYISKEYGILNSRKITRKELRTAYGYDSYAIYKKHELEGLIMYNLLGGDTGVEESIRQFVKITQINDPQKILEIMNSINQVLGVKAILDQDIIVKVLSQK